MLIARESFEQPIRAELFGVERLEQHAASLAAAQETKSGRVGDCCPASRTTAACSANRIG